MLEDDESRAGEKDGKGWKSRIVQEDDDSIPKVEGISTLSSCLLLVASSRVELEM